MNKLSPPLKIRLFCEMCGHISYMKVYRGETGLYPTMCCKKPMLIAGEPKRDNFGLRGKGLLIDPIDEYYSHKVPVKDKHKPPIAS